LNARRLQQKNLYDSPSTAKRQSPTDQGDEARGAIQSDALTLRIFVIRLVGSDLRVGCGTDS
jgi:hypothetical protein